MKRQIIFFIITLSGILFSSCEDFLTELNPSAIDEGLVYADEAGLQSALIGCYNGLLAPMNNEWALTENRSDNTRKSSPNSSSGALPEVGRLDILKPMDTDNFVKNYWAMTYSNIYRCNKVIINVGVVKDEQARVKILGQALFLRAYHYFNLVRLWGGVFLVTDPNLSPEAFGKMQRSSVAEIYQQIESDLKSIIDGNMLPDFHTGSDVGRVSMLAVKALYAKVLMTNYAIGSAEYNTTAKGLLKAVLDARGITGSSDLAALTASYDDIFKITNEMNNEIIFTVRYKASGLGLGSPFSSWSAPLGSSNVIAISATAYGYNYPTTSLVRAFQAKDYDGVRMDWDNVRRVVSLDTAWMSKDPDGNDILIADDELEWPRYSCKFMTRAPVGVAGDAENDFPVLRYGDVVLLYAELLNEVGESAEAVKFLKLTRIRAGLTAEPPTGQAELRQAIRDERRLELVMENHRFFDLVRWGIAVEVINNKIDPGAGLDYYHYARRTGTDRPVSKVTESMLLLPIPWDVINNNPEIQQNDAYK